MRNRHSKCSHLQSYTHIGFLQCQQTNRFYLELKTGLQAANCCTQHVVVANSNESSRLRSQGFWRGCWCGLTGRVRVTSVRNDSSFLPVWPTEVTFSDCQVKIVGEEQAQQVFPYRILYTHWIPPVSTHQSTLCGTESRAASSECCTHVLQQPVAIKARGWDLKAFEGAVGVVSLDAFVSLQWETTLVSCQTGQQKWHSVTVKSRL